MLLGHGSTNRKKIRCDQRRTADQPTVDVRLPEQFRPHLPASRYRHTKFSRPRRHFRSARATRHALPAPDPGLLYDRCQWPTPGSYASAPLDNPSAPMRASTAASCEFSTACVCPASRCCSVSPIQIIGRNPACNARSALDATTASVSPCHWRRSECPTMTQPQPPSRSISAAMSPYTRPADAPIRPALRSRPESVPAAVDPDTDRARTPRRRTLGAFAGGKFIQPRIVGCARPVHFPVCSDQRTTRTHRACSASAPIVSTILPTC